MRRIVVAVFGGAAVLLAACSGVTDADNIGDLAEPRAFPSPQATGSLRAEGVEDVVAEVLPAVVNVVSERAQGQGEGTGFIVREDGIVVTNFHVVERSTAVQVLTSSDPPQEYDARVIGADVEADLAVLDVDAEGLPSVPMGDSDTLRLGQPVVAIGYALGLEGGPSVTSGIVSSLTRRITVPDDSCDSCVNRERIYNDVIQTDAAINPGNSGGPLVDLAGNVIGINTAGTSAAENVGFAIQINAVKPTIMQAAEDPDSPVAFMGIGADDAANPDPALQAVPPVDTGAWIVNVVPDGPAEAAGVEPGDVVIAFDGREISDAAELGEAIRAHEPGDRVEVVLVRAASGQEETVTVELGVNAVPLG